MIFQAEKTVNSLSARFFCFLALIWTCVFTGFVVEPVHGQMPSSDKNRPSRMTDNQITGIQYGAGGETYYQFIGGPGEIVLTADGKTDFYASTMEVNCTDMRGNPVGRLSFAATNSMSACTTKITLPSTQPVIMQVRFYKDDKVKNFVYRITLTGAVQLRNVTGGDATYNRIQQSVDQALSVDSRLRPDRRATTRSQPKYWSFNPDANNTSPEQQEIDARYEQAMSSRAAEIQQTAQARGYDARSQQYLQRNISNRYSNANDPRRIKIEQELKMRGEQAKQARAAVNNRYGNYASNNTAPPVTPVYQPQVSYQAPYQAPIQAPVQAPIQTPIQVPVQTQTAPKVAVIIQDSTSTPVEETPIDDKWALVVGVSKFETPGIDLNYPAKDAKDFRDYLINEANFRPDHVKLLVNEEATKERVMTELGDKWLPKRAHPRDLVVLYVSTHGSPSSLDGGGVNYLVMHNTDPQRLYATGLAVQDVANALKSRVHAMRSVLIMDACHSGSADAVKGLKRDGNVNLDAIPVGSGQMVICSSKPEQVSWESKRYDNGVFTAQLLKALRSNNKNTLSEAFKIMQDNVESEVLKDRGHVQTPVLKTGWRGRELILTVPPAKPHSNLD